MLALDTIMLNKKDKKERKSIFLRKIRKIYARIINNSRKILNFASSILVSVGIVHIALSNKMKKFLNKIPVGVFSVIATVIVVYLLLAPASEVKSSWFAWLNFKHSDKLVHFLMFLFLNLVYLYDYTKYKYPHHTKTNVELAFTTFASMIGLLTESCQLAMNIGREFDNIDVVADVVGAFAAFGLMRWFGGHALRKHVFKRRSRRHSRRSHHSNRHFKDNAETSQNG